MSENNNKFVINKTIVIPFVTGVLIPILISLIPISIDYYKTKIDFSYFGYQIATYQDKEIVKLIINNNSNQIEKNVELKLIESDVEDSEIQVYSSIGVITPTIKKENGNKSFSLGDMRAGQSIRIELFRFYKDKSLFNGETKHMYWPNLADIVVISAERVADYKDTSNKKSNYETLMPWFIGILTVNMGLIIYFRKNYKK